MLTSGGGVSVACGNIFNKNHVQDRPPIISLVVERIDPGAAVYVCPWLIDGPQLMLASLRQIDMLDGSLSGFTWRLSPPSSAMGIWARRWGAMKTWRVAPLSLVPVGMASAALLLGETLSGLQSSPGRR